MESKIGVKGCINIITKYSRRHLSFFPLSSCTALFCPLGGDLFSLFLRAVQSHPQIKLWWVFCCCFFKDPSDGDTQLSAWQHTECVCSGACICFYEVHVDIYSSIHQWQVPTWSWHSQKKHQCILEPLCSRTRTAPAKGREKKKQLHQLELSICDSSVTEVIEPTIWEALPTLRLAACQSTCFISLFDSWKYWLSFYRCHRAREPRVPFLIDLYRTTEALVNRKNVGLILFHISFSF